MECSDREGYGSRRRGLEPEAREVSAVAVEENEVSPAGTVKCGELTANKDRIVRPHCHGVHGARAVVGSGAGIESEVENAGGRQPCDSMPGNAVNGGEFPCEHDAAVGLWHDEANRAICREVVVKARIQ